MRTFALALALFVGANARVSTITKSCINGKCHTTTHNAKGGTKIAHKMIVNANAQAKTVKRQVAGAIAQANNAFKNL